MKKFATSLVFGVLMLPLFASASTVAELQGQLQVLLAQLAALQTQQPQTATPQSGATSCPNFTRNLSRGHKGKDVVALQYFFITKKYLAGGNDSGFYGALTEAAVKQFQCSTMTICAGSPDTNGYGVVGPKTKEAIRLACATQVSDDGDAHASGTPVFLSTSGASTSPSSDTPFIPNNPMLQARSFAEYKSLYAIQGRLIKPTSYSWQTTVHPQYTDAGNELFDGTIGNSGNHADSAWVGVPTWDYYGNANVEIAFSNKEPVRWVAIHTLKNIAADIQSPAKMSVSCQSDNTWLPLGEWAASVGAEDGAYVIGNTEPFSASCSALQIKLSGVGIIVLSEIEIIAQ